MQVNHKCRREPLLVVILHMLSVLRNFRTLTTLWLTSKHLSSTILRCCDIIVEFPVATGRPSTTMSYLGSTFIMQCNQMKSSRWININIQCIQLNLQWIVAFCVPCKRKGQWASLKLVHVEAYTLVHCNLQIHTSNGWVPGSSTWNTWGRTSDLLWK
jgi:hypothetical protein